MAGIRIVFIGAGGVNFGSVEGPWNHAARLIKMPGTEVPGIADPQPGLAAQRVKEWGGHAQFGKTRPYEDWRRMVETEKPDAAIIGVPPAAHGGGKPSNDLERFCARKGVALFIEKPLGCLPPDEIAKTAEVLEKSGVIAAVGYMLRYTKALDFAKRALEETGIKPRHIVLRYACSYSKIRKREWWDTAESGGTIVEQATHFVDAARYLCGEAEMESVSALALGGGFELADKPEGMEEGVPIERQVLRTLSANWSFAGGCLGTLVHTMLLHGTRYETDIDVFGDGLHLHIHDPYHAMRVRIRRPRSDRYEEMSFEGDDPYFGELQAFIRAVESKDRSLIRSPYPDALKTYALTWDITKKARVSYGKPG